MASFTIDNFLVENIITGAPAGQLPGLWHISSRRGSDSGHSASTSLYFGQESVGNYNVGRSAGRITSPSISLVGLSGAQLSFSYFIQTEGAPASYDRARILVSTNDFASSTVVLSNESGLVDPSIGWRKASFNLSSFLGQSIKIRFDFDTVDSAVNNLEGWYLDDVMVRPILTMTNANVTISGPAGTGASVIQQLPVADVTQNHLRDAQIVGDLIQRISSVTDNVMGMVNPGGRKTATEIRTSNTFGVSRLKTTAEFWSEVGYKPLAQVMLQQTQQYYDISRMYRVAGDNGTMENIRVGPEDIAGFFDYIVVDGTLPVDRYAQANLWREILGGLMRMPQLAQTYNIPGIFEWVAQLGGLKNIKRFRVQMAPDQQLLAAMQAGNIVPMGGSSGKLTNQNPGLVERGLGSPPSAAQLPGMGPAG